MSGFHVFPLAAALMLSGAALAQESLAPAASPAAESMQQQCAKAMARHDHGMEKGTPTPMAGACPMAASALPVKSKANRGHDHARFHKLM